MTATMAVNNSQVNNTLVNIVAGANSNVNVEVVNNNFQITNVINDLETLYPGYQFDFSPQPQGVLPGSSAPAGAATTTAGSGPTPYPEREEGHCWRQHEWHTRHERHHEQEHRRCEHEHRHDDSSESDYEPEHDREEGRCQRRDDD